VQTQGPRIRSEAALSTPVAPRFCVDHDTSQKRLKAEAYVGNCQVCAVSVPTNYRELKLCSRCSNRHQRCQICGQFASQMAPRPMQAVPDASREGVGLPASDGLLQNGRSSSSRSDRVVPSAAGGAEQDAKGRAWTPRSGMQALPNSLAWQAWHKEAIKEGLNGASRRSHDILTSQLGQEEVEAKRKELSEGLHRMQSALDEVYLSMLSAPQDPAVASVWSFHMSQLLYDILEGCDYIQRRGQLYAAQSCKSPMGAKMNVGPGDYTKLQQELGNRRQQARDLLQAVKRSSKESNSWIAEWLPFAVCCTNR